MEWFAEQKGWKAGWYKRCQPGRRCAVVSLTSTECRVAELLSLSLFTQCVSLLAVSLLARSATCCFPLLLVSLLLLLRLLLASLSLLLLLPGCCWFAFVYVSFGACYRHLAAGWREGGCCHFPPSVPACKRLQLFSAACHSLVPGEKTKMYNLK